MGFDLGLVWLLLIVLIIVIFAIGTILVQAGVLEGVDIKTCKPDIGELKIAYKFARGPYRKCGALFTEAHSLLPEYKTVGVYYDDPKTTDENNLRYIVGLIISENSGEASSENVKLLEENGYKFFTFPSIDHAVQTYFPFKNTLSIILSIMKVYPALRKYIEERNLCARPFLEIYDSVKKQILFVGPLIKQDDFYVPEVHEEEDIENRQDDDEEDAMTEVSSKSWDESASFIQGGDEANEMESSESSISANESEPKSSERLSKSPEENIKLEEKQESISQEQVTNFQQEKPRETPSRTPDDDSDANTGSSFEVIDDRDNNTLVEEPEQSEFLEEEEEESEVSTEIEERKPVLLKEDILKSVAISSKQEESLKSDDCIVPTDVKPQLEVDKELIHESGSEQKESETLLPAETEKKHIEAMEVEQ